MPRMLNIGFLLALDDLETVTTDFYPQMKQVLDMLGVEVDGNIEARVLDKRYDVPGALATHLVEMQFPSSVNFVSLTMPVWPKDTPRPEPEDPEVTALIIAGTPVSKAKAIVDGLDKFQGLKFTKKDLPTEEPS